MSDNSSALQKLSTLEARLTKKYSKLLNVNSALDRSLVSFQANKTAGGYRWCKYKEGFSASLIQFIIKKLAIKTGKIFDPFVGSGTTLFVASNLGIDSVGIELLPSSAEIIKVRKLIDECDQTKLVQHLRAFAKNEVWKTKGECIAFHHLRITAGAFPETAERELGRYFHEIKKLRDKTLSRVLRFAALCVLESISYTRKDGQYLRWDYRSGRSLGKKPFDKGAILSFTDAIQSKINDICDDISGEGLLFKLDKSSKRGSIELLEGSCLEITPSLEANSVSAIITSPPYCNRYDYTRTYALELAMLGSGEEEVRNLRQSMLSCTVENRDKAMLNTFVDEDIFLGAQKALNEQALFQSILSYLESCKQDGTLNNPGIPRMIRNYFMELAVLIFQCSRIMKPGAPFVMVNDNVRYQGAHIPVDLILSDIAEAAGFEVETIWVLPRGKGNSSQQMGEHGREEIRKCVYIWRAKARQAIQQDLQAAAAW
jgi:DNA modification methylase